MRFTLCPLLAQVRDDMRTAGVMPSEDLISKPDSGERSPCSFDISQAEREPELWCWATRHYHQGEAAISVHTLDNCSNEPGSPTNVLVANEKTPAEQHWVQELNTCGNHGTLYGKRKLWKFKERWMKSGDLRVFYVSYILPSTQTWLTN